MALYRGIILFLLGIFLIPSVRATHLIGGAMSYQYLGQNSKGNYNYKLTLNIYRDCQQSEVQFDKSIKIGIYHSNTNRTKFKTVTINLISKKIVPPPGATNCPFKPSVCIEEGFYEGIIEVDPSTIGYELIFVRCCRNIQNNLKTGSDGMPDLGQTYYCKIPPTNIKNSSPVFKGVPSPYMCANDTTAFLNTATDPDGDSLVYYFVKPWAGGAPTGNGSEPDPPPTLTDPKTVIYNPGYDENKPFGASGYCAIDRYNGLTQYFTTQTGNYVVAIEVAEYRNGVKLSTSRLDLQIIFIDCPPNKKPTITSDKGKVFEIEAGSKLCFNVISTDPDNDNLKLTPSGDIFTGANGWKGPKATLSAKTGRGSIVSEFCWQTSCDQFNAKPYQFAVKVEDDGCPGKFNAVNFSIKVNPFISNAFITGPNSLCQNAIGDYTANNLASKATIEWEAVNGTIISGQAGLTVKIKWTGTTPGKVRLRETSQYACPGEWKEYSVAINPSPPLPVLTGPDTVCLNSGSVTYTVSNFTAGLTVEWTVKTGNIAVNNNSNISVSWPVTGNQIIKVVTRNSNGCVSDTAFKKVNVRKPLPVIFGPASVCPNSIKMEYNAMGLSGSGFSWSISGGTIRSGNNTPKIFVDWGNAGIGTITLIETDRFGCISDPINYSVKKSYVLDIELPKGKMSVCEFEKGVLYYLFPSRGTSFLWNISGGTLLPPGDINAVKVDWGKAGLGIVTVRRTALDTVNNTYCISPPANFDVIINPTPNAATITGDFDVCQLPDSLTYTLNGFAGSRYFWRVNGNSNNISGQGTKSIKLAFNTPGNYKIDVRELSKDSCWGNLVDSVVVVHPKPSARLILGPDIVCDPDFANRIYSVNGFSKSTYIWTLNNGSIIKGNGTDSITVDWTENEPAWLKVKETSEFGCSGDSIYKEVVLDKLNVELLVISVGTPDDRMEITWNNVNSKTAPRSYQVQNRKYGETVWKNIINLNDYVNYTDQPLNTDENPYDYKVNVKDLCGVEKTTEVHTNVWLWGSKTEDPYTVKMDFTPYLGWKNGVSTYVLYRNISDMPGGYQPYDSFVSPQKMTYNNGLEGYKQCYRILSREIAGNKQVSWSNEICFNFAPTIYIPNAFTPNSDGDNDNFTISAGAVKTFDLKIFNRWGEKIYQTNDYKQAGWDGTYKNKPVQMDVYMYTIVLTDFRNKEYKMNGTVHVIR